MSNLRTIIIKGSFAIGTVIDAEATRRMARGGKLDVTIDFVRLADGGKTALRGVKDMRGGGRTGEMTTGLSLMIIRVIRAALGGVS